MTGFIVGLMGFYILLVGYQGNADLLLNEIDTEKNYVPWIVALLVMAALNSNDKTRPVVKPFIALALLTVALEPRTSENIKMTYDYLIGKGTAK